MRHFLLGIAAALLLAAASQAQAQTIVNVQPYQGYICTVTYSNGVSTLEYCPLDWPPANYPLAVSCQCEHLGSPFDDLCEAIVSPYVAQPTYTWRKIGYATFPVPTNPNSEFARFACPRNVPPSSFNCTIEVTVTAPSGATGRSLCYSN